MKAGDVYTNSVESVWNLLEPSVIGTYHKVSMDTLLKLVKAEKLPYAELIESA